MKTVLIVIVGVAIGFYIGKWYKETEYAWRGNSPAKPQVPKDKL